MSAQEYERRIVVGVDGSPTSDEALRWAIRQAQLTGASVDAVTAWEYPASMGGFGLAPMGMYDNTDFAKVAAEIVTAAISRVADPADGGVTVRPESPRAPAPPCCWLRPMALTCSSSAAGATAALPPRCSAR